MGEQTAAFQPVGSLLLRPVRCILTADRPSEGPPEHWGYSIGLAAGVQPGGISRPLVIDEPDSLQVNLPPITEATPDCWEARPEPTEGLAP